MYSAPSPQRVIRTSYLLHDQRIAAHREGSSCSCSTPNPNVCSRTSEYPSIDRDSNLSSTGDFNNPGAVQSCTFRSIIDELT